MKEDGVLQVSEGCHAVAKNCNRMSCTASVMQVKRLRFRKIYILDKCIAPSFMFNGPENFPFYAIGIRCEH